MASTTTYDGATTEGGFSDVVIVGQDYVVRVPDSLPLDGAAPLLCADVTVSRVKGGWNLASLVLALPNAFYMHVHAAKLCSRF
ncbi:hypothetical protein HU200_059798 [Digitaria exilis]|uniref:Uncharacterized protein n=1 Tax=Digitaria exilis TaxID=1010633 RepID=A0A835ABM9_9POAL|nr:hypothetical protein HU200_059798 [Digitaria exilis]